MSKTGSILGLSVFLCAALSSCEGQIFTGKVEKVEGSEHKIIFIAGGENARTKTTAVAGQSNPIDISEETGIAGLELMESVAEMGAEAYLPAAETKGLPIYTENLAQNYKALGVTAYSGSTKWGEEVQYTNESGTEKWSHDYGTGFDWPESEELLFFFRAPLTYKSGSSPFTAGPTYAPSENKDSKGSSKGYGTITFSYVSPGIDASNSAVLQDDILISSKKLSKAQSVSDRESDHTVLLYHTLTGVTFKLTASDENLAITSIDKITFSGMLSSGTCVVKPVYEGYSTGSNSDAGVDKSAVVSLWTPDSGSGKTFSQTYGSDELTLEAGTAKDEKTFMFIPQTLGDDVTLTVEYTYRAKVAGGEWVEYPGNVASVDFAKKITDRNWLAGQIRTYTFTLNKKVEVEIDDTVDAETREKSDLTISNTGTATAYMRVAVLGNWVYDAEEGETDEQGNLIPAAITPCEELVSLGESGVIRSGWFKHSDGFYYYKHPVPGGHTIKPENTLFGEVDFTEEYKTQPYPQCHLEIGIAVQAVRADQVEEAWGQAVSLQLDNQIKD